MAKRSTCNRDYITLKCPLKDMINAAKKKDLTAAAPAEGEEMKTVEYLIFCMTEGDNKGKGQQSSNYSLNIQGSGCKGMVKCCTCGDGLPSMRDGGNRGGKSMGKGNKYYSIKVSNLPESTLVGDLEKLVKPFGPTKKRFLALDKITGQCKGFAYIKYRRESNAVSAIQALNGCDYKGLILNVNWSKQQQQ